MCITGGFLQIGSHLLCTNTKTSNLGLSCVVFCLSWCYLTVMSKFSCTKVRGFVVVGVKAIHQPSCVRCGMTYADHKGTAPIHFE